MVLTVRSFCANSIDKKQRIKYNCLECKYFCNKRIRIEDFYGITRLYKFFIDDSPA
ncbi:hypothetical protein ELI_3770 [Eubacterium callanderi]|uniref:Uncharacterized protein n=1 Tax=Eubacterium callanderi TaxID=53442 RepID=E3GGC1_9FIRM|nr:hypothetical protein ELI_3770 [Eubacterium callanderi]